MTDADDRTFELPATVLQYLIDPAVRTGVDALIDIQPGNLPPDLRLSELADYYAARAAAELMRYDWAAALHRLWLLVWEVPLSSSAWRPVSIDEAAAYEILVTPAACWNDGSFSFLHTLDGYRLFTSVTFDASRTQIAFSVETGDRVLIKSDFGEFVWQDDGDWNGWLVFTHAVSPSDQLFRLADLTRSAAVALAAAQDAVQA